jgi:hypothetical protein
MCVVAAFNQFRRRQSQGICTLQGGGHWHGTVKTAHLAPLKFEHAVLRTGQLQPMVDWYTTVLQAEVSFGNAAIAFFSNDEQNLPCNESWVIDLVVLP